MDDVRQKVEQVLRQEFSGKKEMVSVREEVGIYGVVSSPRFRGLSGMERQRIIDQALKKGLTHKELSRISIIGALAPEEFAEHAENWAS